MLLLRQTRCFVSSSVPPLPPPALPLAPPPPSAQLQPTSCCVSAFCCVSLYVCFLSTSRSNMSLMDSWGRSHLLLESKPSRADRPSTPHPSIPHHHQHHLSSLSFSLSVSLQSSLRKRPEIPVRCCRGRRAQTHSSPHSVCSTLFFIHLVFVVPQSHLSTERKEDCRGLAAALSQHICLQPG